jgi:hypothetical protein
VVGQGLMILRTGKLTAFSAVWAQWTNATIPAVPMMVLARVILDAVDMMRSD